MLQNCEKNTELNLISLFRVFFHLENIDEIHIFLQNSFFKTRSLNIRQDIHVMKFDNKIFYPLSPLSVYLHGLFLIFGPCHLSVGVKVLSKCNFICPVNINSFSHYYYHTCQYLFLKKMFTHWLPQKPEEKEKYRKLFFHHHIIIITNDIIVVVFLYSLYIKFSLR